ncbi:MAG TPA: hypothetical protein VLA56_10320 [Pseudomonadales bacterium]|nr:hypothetical protein [Pseudomonadales bacterium]
MRTRLHAIVLSATIAALLALALWTPLQTAGSDRIDAMFGRALATFATARALNGVISVIQATEVALQPAGVGVTLGVGELLDPLNDLVERFSWVMLAATTALGIQSVLLQASGDPLLSGLLAGLAALAVLRLWWAPAARLDSRDLIGRLLILALFLRLALPLAAIGAEAFSTRWLEPRRERAVAVLQETRVALDEIEQAAPQPPDTDVESMFDTFGRYLKTQRQRFDLKARLAALDARIDQAVTQLLDLVVVFVLQTIVVPLGVIWILWRLTRIVQPAPVRDP